MRLPRQLVHGDFWDNNVCVFFTEGNTKGDLFRKDNTKGESYKVGYKEFLFTKGNTNNCGKEYTKEMFYKGGSKGVSFYKRV